MGGVHQHNQATILPRPLPLHRHNFFERPLGEPSASYPFFGLCSLVARELNEDNVRFRKSVGQGFRLGGEADGAAA